ncbi:MAG: hypothetical protein H7Z16_19520 [Pyrinomonadaceae bacterium]|nr:hypothetical protein [Pyrinomonadaceae bacterium]
MSRYHLQYAGTNGLGFVDPFADPPDDPVAAVNAAAAAAAAAAKHPRNIPNIPSVVQLLMPDPYGPAGKKIWVEAQWDSKLGKYIPSNPMYRSMGEGTLYELLGFPFGDSSAPSAPGTGVGIVGVVVLLVLGVWWWSS